MISADKMGWLGLIGVVVAGLLLASGGASAAGETGVQLRVDTGSILVGENASVDVVVTDASGGVGSFDLTIAFADPGVVNVTETTFAGGPAYSDATAEDDGDVSLTATGADTADGGEVVVATVELLGESAGTTDLDVAVTDVGDEDGRSYAVAETSGASVSVDERTTATPTDESERSGGSDGSGGNGDGSDGGGDGSEDTTTTSSTMTETVTDSETATATASATETDAAVGEATTTATPAAGAAPTPSTTNQGIPLQVFAILTVAVFALAVGFWLRR